MPSDREVNRLYEEILKLYEGFEGAFRDIISESVRHTDGHVVDLRLVEISRRVWDTKTLTLTFQVYFSYRDPKSVRLTIRDDDKPKIET